MVKKNAILFLIIFLFLLLAGCEQPEKFELTDGMIRENLVVVERGLVPNKNFTLSSFEDYNVWNEKGGLLLVRDEDWNDSCWSLFSGDLLFPFEEGTTVSFIERYVRSTPVVYVRTINEDGETTVYDCFGRVIVETDVYTIVDVELDYEFVDGEYEYYEIVRTLLEEDELEGKTNPTERKFLLDPEKKTRTELSDEDYDPLIRESQVDFALFGLEGYTGVYASNVIYLYDENGEFINQIPLISMDYDVGVPINGKVFIQKSYLLDEKSKDFTYIKDGKKYHLSTYTIDLLTGKRKNLKVDYLIHNLETFLNEEGVGVYGYGEISRIGADNLLGSPSYVIIDDAGRILEDFKQLDLKNLVILADNLYYDDDTDLVYDGNLEPLFYIDGFPSFEGTDSVILIDNGNYYGAVDYAGQTVVPFEYYNLSDFYQGRAVGTHKDGKKYFVDLNAGSKTEIEDEFVEIAPDLLFMIRYEDPTYYGRFVDYGNKEILSVEYTNVDAVFFSYLTTLYGRFAYTEFINGTETKYVLIDITLK